MLIRSPKSINLSLRNEVTHLSRRKLLVGAAAMAALNRIEKGYGQPVCGTFYPTPPPAVAAAGMTACDWGDDFDIAGTVDPDGTHTSGYNLYWTGGYGTTSANGQVLTTTAASGSFASPNKGLFRMNGPNFPGSGNVFWCTTPQSTQGKSIPDRGCWYHGAWVFYVNQPLPCNANNQWYAPLWFDTQLNNQKDVTGQNKGFTETDGEENYCANFGFQQTTMTSGSIEWSSDGSHVGGGGTLQTKQPDGTFKETVLTSGFHQFIIIWSSVTSTTGQMQVWFDGVQQYLWNSGNPIANIPTGAGGIPGYRWIENNTPIYGKLGGPPGYNMDMDYLYHYALPAA
jgi:hypothetical protein